MKPVRIYQCLCDETRLRILNLLQQGPLCVCHLQTVLGLPQVKVSKHLAVLRQHGLVEVARKKMWMIYRLPDRKNLLLDVNLACLQDCCGSNSIYSKDLRKLDRLEGSCDTNVTRKRPGAKEPVS